MKQTLQTLKGFRDIFPEEKRQRDFVLNKVREVFNVFGFEPIETPTLEYADLLLGKYGAEAEKLVYTFEDRGGRKIGLRYDQTVPTARILAQYRYNLPKFFRRYQIQNVFRADKPQKGRYREFTHCDIDIFGAQSALADAEILACIYQVYKNIGFKQIQLKINDRQTLFSTLEKFATDKVSVASLIQSVDKLDKQKIETVVRELAAKGLDQKQAESTIAQIQQTQPSKELSNIINLAEKLGVASNSIQLTPTLARGLDYYTGMIFEVIIPEYGSGSCGGGGRYDNLINELGGVEIPAVGFALGFARTVEAAIKLGLIPEVKNSAQVLVTVFDKKTRNYSLQVTKKLRKSGVKTEIYPEFDNLGKQLKLANQKNIPWVIIAGSDEVSTNTVALKDMESGEQKSVSLGDLTKLIK
ncbi:MAG: histidine--tRNA ligase [Patescibacteria group bacterium]|nr:histidine--tRNA ligase [Patescibacteria group bacterium]